MLRLTTTCRVIAVVGRETLESATSRLRSTPEVTPVLAPATRRSERSAEFHSSASLAKTRAGKFYPTKNQSNHLTYEMSQRPQYVGVTKSWNTINAANFFVHDRPRDKAHVAIEDIFIRKFVRGVWHGLFASELVIKRKLNVITLCGFVIRSGLSPKKMYFLIGFTEEMLSAILKCPVNMDFQTVTRDRDLTFKSI